MAFKLRHNAEQWFSEIAEREPFKTKFDIYYFCLIVGLAKGRYSDPARSGDTSREIVDYFIEDYKQSQRLLLGLLVMAELNRYGTDLKERDSVREKFKFLVSPHGKSGLTDEGFKAMNGYASGGYEYLAESRDSKPLSAQEFLRDYINLIGEVFSN